MIQWILDYALSYNLQYDISLIYMLAEIIYHI